MAYHHDVCDVRVMSWSTVERRKSREAIERPNSPWNVYYCCNFGDCCCCCCSARRGSFDLDPSPGTLAKTAGTPSPYNKKKKLVLVNAIASNGARLHNLHFVLSPLFGLLPLRRLVSLVVVILFTAALADHLLPVAESSLLLRRPSDCIAVTVARLVIQSIRFFVLVVGARPLACLRLLVVAVVLVLYISITASLI